MGPPGILFVASRVTKPDKLSDSRFAEWYEGQHIDEVVSLPGVPAAARYEAIPLSEIAGPPTPESLAAAKEPPEYLMRAKWLTLYEMKDVEYRKTDEFMGLDGQSKPKGNLLEEIFVNTCFESRFGALISHDEKVGAKKGPAKIICVATMTAANPTDAEDVERFYEEEHVKEVAKAPGYVRTRRFKYVDTTVLNEFERKSADPIAPGSVLAIHEFEGPYFPMDSLMEADSTPWTAKVLASLKGIEAGFFRLTRVYGQHLDSPSKL